MKQIRARIGKIMMCLLVGISMLIPSLTQVSANQLHPKIVMGFNGTTEKVNIVCKNNAGQELPCSPMNHGQWGPNDEFPMSFILDMIGGNVSTTDYEFAGSMEEASNQKLYSIQYNSNSNEFQYKLTSTGKWITWEAPENKERTIVFLYYANNFLTDLPTVESYDTKTAGIEMNLFNYQANIEDISYNNINKNHSFKFVNHDEGIRDNNKWNDGGGLYQDMVEMKLQNGYPVLTVGNNESLEYLFNPDTKAEGKQSYANVNKLLKKSEDGSYEYNSKDNFAIFNKDTNEFVISEVAGSPSISQFKEGNFFPFNSVKSFYDHKTLNGKELYNIKSPDFHFGMTMEALFLQPQGGQHNNQDMVFEFSGDDDVWVFIDDVLVLDLGGIHGAETGSINFSNGEVIVNGQKATTIKQRFEKAGVTAGFNGETFADATEHSIKFFYLERGAGASNCKLRINLPILPKNGFAVSKEISNYNIAGAIDDTYTFRAYVDKNNDGVYQDNELLKDTLYYVGSNEYRTNAADGTFTLKAGEIAEFKDEWYSVPYKVEEIVDQNRYQDVIITSNSEAVGSYDPAQGIASSGNLTMGTNALVSFNNVVSDAITSSLEIQKKIGNGENDDTFQMIAKINGKLYQGSYTVNSQGTSRTEATNDGILTIKQNETASIEKLPAGTTFEIVENLDLVNAEYQKYSSDVEFAFEANESYGVDQSTINDGIVTGALVTGKETLLYVTNTLIYGKLQIEKQINEAHFENGDPIFTFKIEQLDKQGAVIKTFYRSVRFDQTLDKQTATIDQLQLGDYRVTELPSLRYQVSGDATQTNTIKKADETIVFTFKNKLVNDQYYSHTDIISNRVEYKKDQNGTVNGVVVTQDTLKDVKE